MTSGSRQGAGMTDTIGLLHPGETGATAGLLPARTGCRMVESPARERGEYTRCDRGRTGRAGCAGRTDDDAAGAGGSVPEGDGGGPENRGHDAVRLARPGHGVRRQRLGRGGVHRRGGAARSGRGGGGARAGCAGAGGGHRVGVACAQRAGGGHDAGMERRERGREEGDALRRGVRDGAAGGVAAQGRGARSTCCWRRGGAARARGRSRT